LRTHLLGCLAVAYFCLSVVQGQQNPSLQLLRIITMPNMQGGFNHMSIDARRQRLFASAPSNQTLEVVDLRTGQALRSLGGERPASALYAPEFDQLYVPRGQNLIVYDGASLQQIASIDLHSSLDELHYDSRAKELYVGCMGPGQTGIAIISLPETKLLAKIPLPGKPQGFAVDPGKRRIFANLPELQQVAIVDLEMRQLLTPWSLADFQGIAPIGLDEKHHRLFVGARRPAQLVVMDTNSGKIVAQTEIDSDTDDLFYDQMEQSIYVSCGEGFVDVVRQIDADHYRRAGRIASIRGGRTSALSAPLHRFVIGIPARADGSAELRVFRTGK